MVAFPRSGEQFGRYLIDRVLGQGGMGVVYLATDLQLHRAVALKILQPSLAQGAEFRQRFEREASVLARLRSRHIVQILEYGEVEGTVYLVTEFVPNGDLHGWLEHHGALPPATALAVVRPVLEALEDAHRAGVVHRDVKPSNVLLWQRTPGELIPYLCDFGIATDGDSNATRTGTLIGSVAYMAPERHLGQPASPAGDVYSAGCVLWACLAGRPPYGGTTDFQLMTAHLNEPVPQLPAGAPGASVLNPLLQRALAKNPAERFPTAAMFATAIDRAKVALEDGPATGNERTAVRRPTAPAPVPVSGPPPIQRPVPAQAVRPAAAQPSSVARPTGPGATPPAPATAPAYRPAAPPPNAPLHGAPPPAAPPQGAPPQGAPPYGPPPSAPPPGSPYGASAARPRRRGRWKLLVAGALALLLAIGLAGTGWAYFTGRLGIGPLSAKDEAAADAIAEGAKVPEWAGEDQRQCAAEELVGEHRSGELESRGLIEADAGADHGWRYTGEWDPDDAASYMEGLLDCDDEWADQVAEAWSLSSTGCLHDIGTETMGAYFAAGTLVPEGEEAGDLRNDALEELDSCYVTEVPKPEGSAKPGYREVQFQLRTPEVGNAEVTLEAGSEGDLDVVRGNQTSVSTLRGGERACLTARVEASYPWGTVSASEDRFCGRSRPPRIWWERAPSCTDSPGCTTWQLHTEGFGTFERVSFTLSENGGHCNSVSGRCTGSGVVGIDGRGVILHWTVYAGYSGNFVARVGKLTATLPQ